MSEQERERGHIIILPLSFSSYSHELSVDLSKVTSELEQARKQLQHMKDSSVNDNSEMDTYMQVYMYFIIILYTQNPNKFKNPNSVAAIYMYIWSSSPGCAGSG